jgi:WD40 repeat protein
MEWSECGKYFASVSKDRKLAVFDEQYEAIFGYEAHSRAITCLSFSSNSKYIVTGSRDKHIKIHSLENKNIFATYDVKK